MRLTLKHFLTNELKLPCINPLALLNKLLVQSPLKNLKDYPKDNNSIQVLSYLEVLGCLIDFVIFQAESFFKHCLNYLSNIAIPHIYCHYHQSTLSAVVLLAAKVCDLSAAKDVAQQNDNFIIDFDEKNLIILQIRKLIVNIFEIIVKKYKLVQKHSEIPYS